MRNAISLPRISRLFSANAPQLGESQQHSSKGFSFGRVLFGSAVLSTASITGAIVFSAENPGFRRLLETNLPAPAAEWFSEGQKQYLQLKSLAFGSRSDDSKGNFILCKPTTH